MAYLITDRLNNRTGRVSRRNGWGFVNSFFQQDLFVWSIVVVVGIFLGVFLIAFDRLPSKWAPLLLVGVIAPFIAMIVKDVRRLLLAIILLDIPLALDVSPNYNEGIAEIGAMGGFQLSVTTISLLILYAMWLMELMARRSPQPRSRQWSRSVILPTVYVGFTGLSVIAALNITFSLYEIVLLLQTLLLFIYIVGTVRTRQDVLFIITFLILGFVIESMVMVGLRVIGHSVSFAGISARISPGSRVSGTLGSPNTAGSYLSFLLALSLSIFLLTKLKSRQLFFVLLVLGIGGVALFFTRSRGGWVALAVSLTILIFLIWRRGLLSARVLLIIIFVMLLILLFQDTILARFLGDDRGSAQSRIPMMSIAYQIIQDYPVLGVGINNYALIMRQYYTEEFSRVDYSVVHNNYLRIWAETGIGGLVTFILFLFATIRQGLRCWRFGDRFLSPLSVGLTVAIVGHMVHMFVDRFQGRPLLQLLWLSAGLIIAMSLICNEEKNIA